MIRGSWAAFLAAMVVGCGQQGMTVKEKITFKDKPVNAGTVIWIDAAGKEHRGVITFEGKYEVAGLRKGLYKVAIDSPPPMPGKAAGSGKPPPEKKGAKGGLEDTIGEINAVDAIYRDPAESGLLYEIRGDEQIDIALPRKK